MRTLWLLGLITLGIIAALTINRPEVQPDVQSDKTLEEYPVVTIPLEGPLADRNAEISGLAWWGDRLILLLQYPERMGGRIFAIDKAEILNWLAEKDDQVALAGEAIAFEDGGLANVIEGYEGYEAIAFQKSAQDRSAFLTIESETSDAALGHIVRATIAEDGNRLSIDPISRVEVRPQSTSPNKAEESLLLTDAQIVSLYEVNGAQLNPEPVAHTFNLSLTETAPIPFPQIEYRITDTTALDEQNQFWAINYFYPGDSDLEVRKDPLVARYGEGETHQRQPMVERLVEFAYAPDGIVMTDTPPIQLMLGEESRNWEGIVRLGDQGFLLVTDKFPDTILGFVEF